MPFPSRCRPQTRMAPRPATAVAAPDQWAQAQEENAARQESAFGPHPPRPRRMGQGRHRRTSSKAAEAGPSAGWRDPPTLTQEEDPQG